MKQFTYVSGGEKGQVRKLKESPEYVAVRTKGNESLTTALKTPSSKKLRDQFTVKVDFPEANVSVLKAKGTSSKRNLELRNQARESFKKEKDIRFAGRVLVDSKTKEPVLYTENFLVKFKQTVSREVCLKILAENNLTIKKEYGYIPNGFFVEAKEGTGLKIFDIAQKVRALPEVEECEPELIREKTAKLINVNQWHLKKTLIGNKVVDAHANVEAAFQYSTGKGVLIAIIDDGVDIDHEEFNISKKIVAPRDIKDKSSDPRPKLSGESHGTACAGVACAAGKFQASGVAPDARLMPIRLHAGLGSELEAESFQYATDNGADVISCSWGAVDGDWDDLKKRQSRGSCAIGRFTRYAIEYASTKGRNGKGCIIIWCAGNGNENCDVDEYVSNPNVIAVAACNDRSTRSIYSDYGKCIWVSFPSNDWDSRKLKHPKPLTSGIWTTDRVSIKGYNRKKTGNYCSDFWGTSSAAPAVAGVVALMLSANPDLSAKQVKKILKETADKIDVKAGKYKKGHSIYYGYGRVNAENAVKKAIALKD